MLSRTARWAALAPLLIVTVLSGCDNVIWGGADIQIVPPPPVQTAQIESDVRLSSEFGLPTGPLLFHLIDLEEGGSRLVPVAELVGNSIRELRRPAEIAPSAFEQRFRDTVVPLGAQFDVFRRGARVGTFVAQREGPLDGCGIPSVIGTTTVVAAAVGAPEYLAFRQGLAPSVRGEFTPAQITGPIRTYASILAERLILQSGLPRPRSWAGAQRDVQPIDIVEGGHPEMAATYLVGDQLRVGEAEPDGYSVFYLADYTTQRGYMPIYSEVHDYRRSGKVAPRLVDHVAWTENGPEVLVQLYGRNQSWYEIIAPAGEEWTKVWEGGRCQ